MKKFLICYPPKVDKPLEVFCIMSSMELDTFVKSIPTKDIKDWIVIPFESILNFK
jgi:hypothetical protein